MISISLDLFVLIGKFIVSLTQNIAQYIRILFFSKRDLTKGTCDFKIHHMFF